MIWFVFALASLFYFQFNFQSWSFFWSFIAFQDKSQERAKIIFMSIHTKLFHQPTWLSASSWIRMESWFMRVTPCNCAFLKVWLHLSLQQNPLIVALFWHFHTFYFWYICIKVSVFLVLSLQILSRYFLFTRLWIQWIRFLFLFDCKWTLNNEHPFFPPPPYPTKKA